MTEYLSASITIGGTLAPESLKDLLEAIVKDRACEAMIGEILTEVRLAAQVAVLAARGDVLHLYRDEAPWGEFPAIEAVCRQSRLSYRRTCASNGDMNAEMTVFLPPMEEARCLAADNGGQALIPVEDILKARNAGNLNKTLNDWAWLAGTAIPPLRADFDVTAVLDNDPPEPEGAAPDAVPGEAALIALIGRLAQCAGSRDAPCWDEAEVVLARHRNG